MSYNHSMTPKEMIAEVGKQQDLIQRTDFHYQVKRPKGYHDLWLANHGTVLKVLMAGTPQKVKPLVVTSFNELLAMLGTGTKTRIDTNTADARAEGIKEGLRLACATISLIADNGGTAMEAILAIRGRKEMSEINSDIVLPQPK